jgi:hypothetical protein
MSDHQLLPVTHLILAVRQHRPRKSHVQATKTVRNWPSSTVNDMERYRVPEPRTQNAGDRNRSSAAFAPLQPGHSNGGATDVPAGEKCLSLLGSPATQVCGEQRIFDEIALCPASANAHQ